MNREVDNILEVKDLKMYFPVMGGGVISRKVADIKAVDGVSFTVERGKTLGLVGESGCGKTTIGKCLLSIYEPTAGEIIYDGKELFGPSKKGKAANRREIMTIFQDPLGSLDPRQSVHSMLKEAIILDKQPHTSEEVDDQVNELLDSVEINRNLAKSYPHEMSRGQMQRLGIARALACNPKLIVCDEPVSSLDVSIQAQVINLLRKLQRERGLSYLFIAHDISVVRHIAEVIAIMYLGRIVEMMEAEELYAKPMHPYALALLSAIPLTDYYVERQRERIVLKGEVPSPIDAPPGCTFNPRCPYATDICRQQAPGLNDVGGGHKVACHNLEAVANHQKKGA